MYEFLENYHYKQLKNSYKTISLVRLLNEK